MLNKLLIQLTHVGTYKGTLGFSAWGNIDFFMYHNYSPFLRDIDLIISLDGFTTLYARLLAKIKECFFWFLSFKYIKLEIFFTFKVYMLELTPSQYLFGLPI